MLVTVCTRCNNTHRAWDWDFAEITCPNCDAMLYDFRKTRDWNGAAAPLEGEDIQGVPPDTMLCYTEARVCAAAMCFAACEHTCRKVLMHVAVDQGAGEGLKFIEYINFLLAEGHISKNMEKWVAIIKNHGNRAAHELEPVSKERALNTLYFTTALLKIIYEVPLKAGVQY